MGDQDAFLLIEMIMQGILAAVDYLMNFIISLFTPQGGKGGPSAGSGDSHVPTRIDYDRLTKNYIPNMSEEEQAKLEKIAGDAAVKTGHPEISGKDVVDYMKIHQKEKIDEMQQQFNIKDDRVFKDPGITKEELVKNLSDKIEELKPEQFTVPTPENKVISNQEPLIDPKPDETPTIVNPEEQTDEVKTEEQVKNPEENKEPVPQKVTPPYPSRRIHPQCEFLTVAPAKAQSLSVNQIAFDGTKLKDRLISYYSNSTTVVPVEILRTGNVKHLQNYVNFAYKNGILKNNSTEMIHLMGRIAVMNEIEKYSKYNNEHEIKPDKQITNVVNKNNNQNVTLITNSGLGRKQDTVNGCWSCAMEVLFKTMGIQLDQSQIRAYKPDFVNLKDGPQSPREIDTILSDSMYSIQEYAELVGKVSPNTMVSTLSTSANTDNRKDVIDAVSDLIAANTAVAFTNGGHYRTIVGQDKDNFYVIDSNQDDPNTLRTVSKQSLITGTANLDFTWMEKMQVDKDGKIAGINPKLFKVDNESGALIKGEFNNPVDGIEKTASLKKDGHFFETKMHNPQNGKRLNVTRYLPKAFRKFEMEYSKQQELIEKKIPSPKEEKVDMSNYKFTKMSDFNKENISKKLQDEVRLKYMKQIAGFKMHLDKDTSGTLSPDILKGYENDAKSQNIQNPYAPLTNVSKKDFETFYGKDARLEEPKVKQEEYIKLL